MRSLELIIVCICNILLDIGCTFGYGDKISREPVLANA
jgi:hypothetical protein